jgi:hypothetical protein
MLRSGTLGLLLAFLALAPTAHAQERIGVLLSFTASDTLGERLGSAFRERLGRSATFREVPQPAESAFTLNVATLDPTDQQTQTIYSFVILLTNPSGLDGYLGSYVGACGPGDIQDCANNLYAGLEEQLEVVRQRAGPPAPRP